jgi:pimeloyl-ACP methyl ester carboxylesterase
VNGVELEYMEEGDGVPVVFSHGAGLDLRYWEPQRKVFSKRHRSS